MATLAKPIEPFLTSYKTNNDIFWQKCSCFALVWNFWKLRYIMVLTQSIIVRKVNWKWWHGCLKAIIRSYAPKFRKIKLVEIYTWHLIFSSPLIFDFRRFLTLSIVISGQNKLGSHLWWQCDDKIFFIKNARVPPCVCNRKFSWKTY